MMVIGMNMTFGPMHILGLQGQPRRMYQWTEARAGEGFFNLAFWNMFASIGSLVLTTGVLLFLINIVITARNGKVAPLDPWDARSLEWMTTNPPKEHNFDSIPTISHLDEFFHRKYEEDANGQMVKVKSAEQVLKDLEDNADAHIHMPSPSYWPIVLAAGLPVIAFGMIYSIPIAIFGGVIVLFGCYGWAIEPSTAPDDDFDPMLYRGRVGEGPRPSQVFDIPFTSVSSFVLLMSSLTMVLAVSAAHKGDERNTSLWVAITALLGATFVGGQVYEFTAFYNEGMGFTTSLFSSSFYVLTGFHGVHVTVGIIMLMSTVGILKRSKVPGSKAETVEMIGLYWHFVDVVWIIIFTLIYLIPA